MPRYGKWDQLRTFLYPARAVLDLQVALESGPFRPVRYQFHSREDVVPVFARDGTEPISCNPHASSVPPQDGKESRDSRMLPRTASTAAEGRGGQSQRQRQSNGGVRSEPHLAARPLGHGLHGAKSKWTHDDVRFFRNHSWSRHSTSKTTKTIDLTASSSRFTCTAADVFIVIDTFTFTWKSKFHRCCFTLTCYSTNSLQRFGYGATGPCFAIWMLRSWTMSIKTRRINNTPVLWFYYYSTHPGVWRRCAPRTRRRHV